MTGRSLLERSEQQDFWRDIFKQLQSYRLNTGLKGSAEALKLQNLWKLGEIAGQRQTFTEEPSFLSAITAPSLLS